MMETGGDDGDRWFAGTDDEGHTIPVIDDDNDDNDN